jgi:hypothetical protein
MERIEHKDLHGNVISVSEKYSEAEIAAREKGAGALAILVGVCATIYYFWEAIAAPEKLRLPYSYFAKIYQYILYYPYFYTKDLAINLWRLLLTITPYKNLNCCLSLLVLGIIAYVFVKVINLTLIRTGRLLYYVFLGPGAIWALYWVGEITLTWLLKT